MKITIKRSPVPVGSLEAVAAAESPVKVSVGRDERPARQPRSLFSRIRREGAAPEHPPATSSPQPEPPRPEPEPSRAVSPQKRAGWISPIYSMTRCIQADHDTAEKNHVLTPGSPAEDQQYYNFIRSRIRQKLGDTAGTTIMVTSPLSGEGKTLTAVNLALTLARDYEHTVLLVDADLKRPRIHEVLGYESSAGLVDNLLEECPLHELMVCPGIEKLTVISGGSKSDESSELLRSPRMRHLVVEMRDRYPNRYVLFDAPAVLSGTDAVNLATSVDHIIVTVRAGVSTLPDLNRALDLLPQDKILGVILNGIDNG